MEGIDVGYGGVYSTEDTPGRVDKANSIGISTLVSFESERIDWLQEREAAVNI